MNNVFELVTSACLQVSERTSWSDARHTLSYQQLSNNISVTAARLIEEGMSEQAAIYIENSVEFVIALFSCIKAGVAPLLINSRFPKSLVERIMAEHGVTSLLLQKGSKTFDDLAVKQFFIATAPAGCNLETDLAYKHNDIAFKLHTSGTTGYPKIKPYSHEQVISSIQQMDWGWPVARARENWLVIAPFSHIYGILMGVLNPLFTMSSTIIMQQFSPTAVCKHFNEDNITIFGGGPPSLYQALLQVDNLAESCSGVKMFPGGGALFSSNLLECWQQASGKKIRVGYGMTELAPLAINVHDTQGSGCVGVAPPGIELSVRNTKVEFTDGCERLVGEVIARASSSSTTQENREWIATGDVGYLSENKHLFLLGRCKDIVIVNGYNVFPQQIEDALCRNDGVSQSCVIGVPCEVSGEKLVAFVVFKVDVPADEASLVAYCKAHLPHYAVPKQFYLTDQIPLTAIGKPDKLAMARMCC